MPYQFEVFTDKKGGTRFRFRASNNEIMGASESYTARASALAAIRSLKKNVPGAAKDTPYKFEVYEDKRGETRFRFRAPNGEIMFGSEGYAQRSSALACIRSLKKNMPGADKVNVEK